MSLWAGQTYSLIEAAPAADVVRRLDVQARTAIRNAAARFTGE
jgi:nitronate monooxygenase